MADNATQQAAEEMESLQEKLLGAAPPLQARNINIDAHQGHMPQRPYGRLEDQLARIVTGWQSYDQLLAALPAAQKAKIAKGDDGALYRLVPEGTGVQVVGADGLLYDQVRKTRRAIALQQKIAKGQSAAGTPTDYWNGFTWLRNGFKPEQDFTDIVQSRAVEAEEIELVPASEQDQSLHRAAQLAGAAGRARSEASRAVTAMNNAPARPAPAKAKD